jgi:hypothetical protein
MAWLGPADHHRADEHDQHPEDRRGVQLVAAHRHAEDRADDGSEEDPDHAANRAGAAQQHAVQRERDTRADGAEHEERAECRQIDPATSQADQSVGQRQHRRDDRHPQHRGQRAVFGVHRLGDVGSNRVAQQCDREKGDALHVGGRALIDRRDRDDRDPGEDRSRRRRCGTRSASAESRSPSPLRSRVEGLR